MMLMMVSVWWWGHVPVPVRYRGPERWLCIHVAALTSHTVTAVTSQGRLLQTNAWPSKPIITANSVNDKLLVCSGTNCVFGTSACFHDRSDPHSVTIVWSPLLLPVDCWHTGHQIISSQLEPDVGCWSSSWLRARYPCWHEGDKKLSPYLCSRSDKHSSSATNPSGNMRRYRSGSFIGILTTRHSRPGHINQDQTLRGWVR